MILDQYHRKDLFVYLFERTAGYHKRDILTVKPSPLSGFNEMFTVDMFGFIKHPLRMADPALESGCPEFPVPAAPACGTVCSTEHFLISFR